MTRRTVTTRDNAGQPGRASASWPRESFIFADDPYTPMPDLLDITGRPRVLIYGPYENLGPGRWRARIEFELLEEAGLGHFMVEFGYVLTWAHVKFRGSGPGRYAVEVDHDLQEATRMEIRFTLMKAALHGGLRLLGVRIDPAPVGAIAASDS